MLGHVALHLVGQATRGEVAGGDEVGFPLMHHHLAVRDLLEPPGHAVVVGVDVGDDELGDLGGVAAVFAHAVLEGGVGGVRIPATVDEHCLAPVLDQVGEDVGQALGDTGLALELAPKPLRLLALVLGEGGEQLVDAIENFHGKRGTPGRRSGRSCASTGRQDRTWATAHTLRRATQTVKLGSEPAPLKDTA